MQASLRGLLFRVNEARVNCHIWPKGKKIPSLWIILHFCFSWSLSNFERRRRTHRKKDVMAEEEDTQSWEEAKKLNKPESFPGKVLRKNRGLFQNMITAYVDIWVPICSSTTARIEANVNHRTWVFQAFNALSCKIQKWLFKKERYLFFEKNFYETVNFIRVK